MDPSPIQHSCSQHFFLFFFFRKLKMFQYCLFSWIFNQFPCFGNTVFQSVHHFHSFQKLRDIIKDYTVKQKQKYDKLNCTVYPRLFVLFPSADGQKYDYKSKYILKRRKKMKILQAM